MSVSRISPVRGSWTCGPEAFWTVDGSQRMTEWRASSGLQSGSSSGVGASRAMTALLNPGRLERRPPGLDALLDVGHPLRRRGRIDPVGDRLHRIRDLGVRILLFQPPAGDVAAAGRTVLVAAVVDLPDGEVADPFVEQARLHRVLGQLDHAVVEQHGGAAGPHAAPAGRGPGPVLAGRRRRQGIGVRGLHLDVLGEGGHALDEGPIPREPARLEPGPRAELGDLPVEQRRHVDDRRAVFGSASMSNALMIVSLFAASTARAMGCSASATSA